MAHETRTSERGDVFDASTVRNFLLKALDHDAVIDRVNELLFDYATTGRPHPSVITESLKPIITEVLDVATYEDWDSVASALITDAREALDGEHIPADAEADAKAIRTDDDVNATDQRSAHRPARTEDPLR